MLHMQQSSISVGETIHRRDEANVPGARIDRDSVDIGKLDALVQEALANYCSVNGFSLTVWRDKGDPSGCNWNGRLEPLPKCAAVDTGWWDVIPRLRERYNLAPIRKDDRSQSTG